MVFLFRLRDGTLLDFNETVCATLGYTHDELLALRATDVRTDATPESLRTEIAEAARLAGAQQHGDRASIAARTAAPSRWRAGAASSTRRRAGCWW